MSTSPFPTPAFPYQFTVEVGSVHPFTGNPATQRTNEIFPGMTLRDYFAAKAMQGDISSMQAHEDPASAAHHIAARAYAVADAMLKAREEGGAA